LLTLSLVTLDVLALVTAFLVAYGIRFKTGVPLLATPAYSGAAYSTLAVWTVPVWLGLFAAYRLYDRRLLFGGLQEYVGIVQACTTGLLAEVMLSFLYPDLSISRGWLLLTWLLSSASVGGGRFAARRMLRALRRRGQYRLATLIVGVNEEAIALAEQLRADPSSGPHVIGFIDNSAPSGTLVIGDLRVIGSLDSIANVVRRLQIKEVVAASTALTRDQLLELYRTIGQDPAVELRLSSGLFEILNTGMLVQEISGVPLMTPQRVRITGPDALLKSVLDYGIATVVLLVLTPFMLLIALLVHLDSRGPVIHRRRVLGVSGKPFEAFKFRTMVVDAERRQRQMPIQFAERRGAFKSKADPRITRIGRFLRRTSLDELPQLLNVLRGEMSLVGPRMIAPDEATRYGKWQFNLATVKPGITGPWQVRGRGDIPYEERVRLSMHYIRNYSIWLDLEILFRTVFVVLRGKGAY
jgi:exopolysaccharide biosynthesis polyprenyl glycosylphosphotransferase